MSTNITSTHDSKTNSYLQKARLIGLDIRKIDVDYDSFYYLISRSKQDHLVLIPENSDYIGNIPDMYNLKGNIKVVGGSGLMSTKELFKYTSDEVFGTLDLTEMDTSNVRDMSEMFFGLKVNKINFGDFKTNKVADMERMFWWCETPDLDLSSFNTSNVYNMSNMFSYCKIDSINLSSFNTSKLEDASFMFAYCLIKSLDLRNFNLIHTTKMCCMFAECKAKLIDLTGVGINEKAEIAEIFDQCIGEVRLTDKKLLQRYKGLR